MSKLCSPQSHLISVPQRVDSAQAAQGIRQKERVHTMKSITGLSVRGLMVLEALRNAAEVRPAELAQGCRPWSLVGLSSVQRRYGDGLHAVLHELRERGLYEPIPRSDFGQVYIGPLEDQK